MLSRANFDVRLYTHECDHPELPYVDARDCADVVLAPHFQGSELVVFHFGIHSPLLDLLPVVPMRAKKIVVFHNITPPAIADPLHRPLIERSFSQLQNLRWADRIICVSETNRDVLRQHGIDRDTVVIPLAIHSELEAPQSKPSFEDEILRLAFIGRFTRSKGPDDLLQAVPSALAGLEQTGYRRVQVDLVGNLEFSDRTLLDRLANQIASMRARQSAMLDVFMHGNATEEIKHRLLREAHVFVLPTQHEGFCVPIVEAIASGCRVIAYENSNTPAICGGLGNLVKTSDIDALARALLEVSASLRRPEWRAAGPLSYARYLQAGRAHVQQFSAPHVERRFLEAVRGTLGHPTPLNRSDPGSGHGGPMPRVARGYW